MSQDRWNRRSFVRNGTLVALAANASLLRGEGKASARIGVTPKDVRQSIDGFGFSEAFHAARVIRLLGDKERTKLLDLMFLAEGGMGYSILRCQIGDGPKGAGERDGTVASIEPKEDEYNWAGDEDQIWLMNEAKKRGCTRFFSTAWSPPAWMKTNDDTWDGRLKPAMYQAYADYLATYVLEYKKRYDLEIYAISPANEPGFIPKQHYGSSRWTAAQMKKFLRENLIPAFAAKNVTAGIVINERNDWHDDEINEILSDPVCEKAIEIVAAHAYADTTSPYMPIGLRTGRFKKALALKKRVWQTEVSADDPNIVSIEDGIYWAKVLHTHMVEDDVSAWLYWWGAQETRTRSSLVVLDSKAKTFQVAKRLLTIGQYARFIRPGYHRLDANPNPAAAIFFSAYMEPSGKKLIAVAINEGGIAQPLQVQMGDFKATSCKVVRTSEREAHEVLPSIAAGNGVVDVIVAPKSVTTYVMT